VVKILEQNIKGGTGTKANIGCPAFGKTGTTDNFNDAWFAGGTPALSTAVWVGYPNALREMRSVHGVSVAGGTFPAQIWHDFMMVAKGPCKEFPPPKERVQFHPFFGRYSSTGGQIGGSNDYYKAPPPKGSGDTSAGGQKYRGYDPRLYESPPQDAPKTVNPPGEKPKKNKGGRGKNGGGGPQGETG
jgi:penicillin-binding protein 1A